MENQFTRTEALIGTTGISRIKNSMVTVCGIGGVGSYAAEALARAGVGQIVLVDYDFIAESNINRQIHATHKTIGLYKVEVMKERLRDINPGCIVYAKTDFITDSNIAEILKPKPDYIIDAVDNVTAKIALVVYAKAHNIQIISSMGAANRLCPMFELTDIYKTSTCPLAKVMRRELKKRGINSLLCCCSKEQPRKISDNPKTLGSVSFVPPAAGLVIAGHVVRALAGV